MHVCRMSTCTFISTYIYTNHYPRPFKQMASLKPLKAIKHHRGSTELDLYYITMEFWQCIQTMHHYWNLEQRASERRRWGRVMLTEQGLWWDWREEQSCLIMCTVQLAETLSCLKGLDKLHQVTHSLSESAKNMCSLGRESCLVLRFTDYS